MTSKFSSTSIETTLQSAITTSGATSMTVATGTGTALMGGVTLAPGNVDVFTVAIDVDTILSVSAPEINSITLSFARNAFNSFTASAFLSKIS